MSLESLGNRQNTAFDDVARDYHASAPVPPDAYTQMLIRELGIQPGWWFIELGCGSGMLATALFSRGVRVTGVDCSHEQLSIAREGGGPEGIGVEWVEALAEDYYPNRYDIVPDIIFSYESFHLFGNKRRVLENAASYLRLGGFFAIGWADYHWERLLREIIVKVFSRSGVEWGEWGYQRCPEFVELIESQRHFFTSCRTSRINVHERTSVAMIAKFLANIGKATELSKDIRNQLMSNLEEAFLKEYNASEVEGQTTYWLRYAIRHE